MILTNHETLRLVSAPVSVPEPEVVDAMVQEALAWEESNPGRLCAAMSAIQLGVPKQVMIVRINREKPSLFEAYYNPIILDRSAAMESAHEGCMSVPGPDEYALRPLSVTVEVYDKRFNKQVIEAKGYFARMWEHEVDHMAGRLFNDPRVKR